MDFVPCAADACCVALSGREVRKTACRTRRSAAVRYRRPGGFMLLLVLAFVVDGCSSSTQQRPHHTTHPCDPLPTDQELATWPVDSVCEPGSGPVQPDRVVVKTLGDGTQVIESLGRCTRVRYRRCQTVCLPPDVRISTPAGEIAVRDVRVGTQIWTQDASGQRVARRVEKIANTLIRGEHHVAHVVLSDGRTLIASPQHPLVAGVVEDLRVGAIYDGATIVKLEFVRYTGDRTYDILPAGTGVYWANGILVKSTLSP